MGFQRFSPHRTLVYPDRKSLRQPPRLAIGGFNQQPYERCAEIKRQTLNMHANNLEKTKRQ